MFVFSTYLPVFLLKFWVVELIGCEIWFQIQRLPTLHTFDKPRYPKNKKSWKNVMMTSSSHFFQVFLIFGVAGSVKSMLSGYSLDSNLIMHPRSSSDQNLSKNTGRYVENTSKIVVFLFSSSKLVNIILLF